MLMNTQSLSSASSSGRTRPGVHQDPLLSTRISLAWPPNDPPSESTHTIVFSGTTGWYMDMRVFIDEVKQAGRVIGDLDWASVGRKEYTADSTPGKIILTLLSPMLLLLIPRSGSQTPGRKRNTDPVYPLCGIS